jgi:hypothetical protein
MVGLAMLEWKWILRKGKLLIIPKGAAMHSRTPFLLVFFVVLFAAIGGCMRHVEMDPPPKWFLIDAASSSVSFHGQWRPTAQAGILMNWAANTVEVTCDHASMQCEEVLALLYAPGGPFPRRSLDLVRLTYRVSEWTDSIIRADSASPAGDFELRISLTDKVAERSFRETKGRGSENADPSIVRNWVFNGR